MKDLNETLSRLMAEAPSLPADNDERVAEAERVERLRRRDIHVRRLGLPITARDEATLVERALTDTAVLCAVRAWMAEGEPEHRWLVLCGPPGRGKTIAAADALADHGGRYIGARELERVSMAKFGNDQEAFAKLLSTSLLVIDDLGREDDLGRMQTALLDLVDYRRRRGHRTIAITNFSRKAFEQRYSDARLQSRLAECAQWFADVGEDMRRAK